jgi:two-component system sensor histidine kinase NreB
MCIIADELVLRVEDNGVGFDSRQLADEERTDGGGFGLYSIRERLNLFGGKVTIISQLGHGTQVVLALPQSVALQRIATDKMS